MPSPIYSGSWSVLMQHPPIFHVCYWSNWQDILPCRFSRYCLYLLTAKDRDQVLCVVYRSSSLLTWSREKLPAPTPFQDFIPYPFFFFCILNDSQGLKSQVARSWVNHFTSAQSDPSQLKVRIMKFIVSWSIVWNFWFNFLWPELINGKPHNS